MEGRQKKPFKDKTDDKRRRRLKEEEVWHVRSQWKE